MRLFGVLDGVIDRKDRTLLLTPIFDLAWDEPAVPPELPSVKLTFPIVYTGIMPLSVHLISAIDGVMVADWTDLESGSFETTVHGFGQLTARRKTNVADAFALYSNVSPLHVVISDGADRVYVGRADSVVLQNTGTDLNAFGYWSATNDVLYTALWSDTGPGNWNTVAGEQFPSAATSRYEVDKYNRLYLAPMTGEKFGASVAHGMFGYKVPDRSRRPIVAVEFTYQMVAPAPWKARFTRHDDDWSLLSTEWGLTGNGELQEGTVSLTFDEANVVAVSIRYDDTTTTYDGETGDVFLRLTSVRVKTHTAEDITADLIVKDIVACINEVNPGQIQASTAFVQSPGIDLTNIQYEDKYALAALSDVSSYGDDQNPPRPWYTVVWGDRYLSFAPFGYNGRDWYVDAVEIEMERNLGELRNSVYSVYRSSGETRRTEPIVDGQSAIRHGLVREKAIDAGRFESVAFARTLAQLTLSENSSPIVRASLVLTGVYDRTGVASPLYNVRAGDTMTIRNLPPDVPGLDRIRTFRLKSTRYDLVRNILYPVPENDLPTLDILVLRKEINI